MQCISSICIGNNDFKILIDKKAELETAINKIDKRILQIKDNFIF
jgi:hypothetical protein